MDTHARREDPEPSHLSSETNQGSRQAEIYQLLDVMVTRMMSSFTYRRGSDDEQLTQSRHALSFPDHEISAMAGFDHREGKWKRCSDLRRLGWIEWLVIDGRQKKVANQHTGKFVGVSIVTVEGLEAWLAWKGEGP